MATTKVRQHLDGHEPSAGDDRSGASSRRWSRRRSALALGGVVTIGVVAAIIARSGSGDDGTADPIATTDVGTAEVRDLVQTEVLEGELGFGAGQQLTAGRGGVVTGVAGATVTLAEGDIAYSVDLEPTVVLEGSVPAYRDLSTDSPDGPDVAQLEQALVDLGIAPDLTVDESFTSVTANAVETWEEALGRAEPDGNVTFGDVMFTAGPVRVSTRAVDVGASIQQGSPVLTFTSTAQVVTVDLAADRAGILAVDDTVGITLPDGTDTTGTVTEISTESAVDESDPTAEPTVPVTIRLDDTAAAETLDTGTVDVIVERSRVEDVVAVPVTALLALAEGGYAIEVIDAATGSRLVPVQVGAYADGYVQVTGDTVTEGTQVVVAA